MMSPKERIKHEKIGSSTASVALYTAAIIAGLIAIASLVNTITFFNFNVSQYVAQGYPAADVYKQLVPSSLLPDLFRAVAGYGGIAFVLFGAGKINRRVTKCLALLNKTEAVDTTPDESIIENSQANGPDL